MLGGQPVPAAFMSETWTEGGADFWASALVAFSVAVAWVRTERERRRVVRNFMMGERVCILEASIEDSLCSKNLGGSRGSWMDIPILL